MKRLILLLTALMLAGQLSAESYQILHSFGDSSGDGYYSVAGLALDGSTLCGTTISGGKGGNGTLFKLNTDGTGFTNLHYFSWSDGANPSAGLALSGDTLCGMTVNGGNLYDGTLFKMKTNGADYVVLKHYLDPDGAWPRATPIVIGNTLFGTTVGGGDTNRGTIFKVKTDGSDYTVLKNLNPTDGFYPYSRLVLSGSTLYGTTDYGGSHYNGVVFALGVPPEIEITDGSFGVQSNAFGFNVSGISNQVLVIEACSNLATAQWEPLRTNILGNAALYFSDPAWTNYPGRFYRARTP